MSVEQTPASISCSNSQGTHLAANVLRLKRYSVVFEIYNPYSIVQTSEVLDDFKIYVDQKIIYSGKATVSSLLNTGIFLVCEVILEDAWIDVQLYGASESSSLSDQLQVFFNDWQTSNDIEIPVKLVVSDMENLFVGMQKWLERIDLSIRSTSTRSRVDIEKEVFSEIKEDIVTQFDEMLATFVDATQEIPEKNVPMHKAYIRRQLHPLLLCSPFLYRTYAKPLGYAGDYEMVNMMLRDDQLEGASVFAKLINYAFLKTPPVLAHRNRIDFLVRMIAAQAEEFAKRGKRLKVFNLGCGPAEEVARIIRDEDVADMIDFTLVDFNEETIQYTKKKLDDVRFQSGKQTKVEFVKRSVHQVLKMASQGAKSDEQYDLVYCAGLFDYFSQKVCAKLVSLFVEMVPKDGKVVVTNVSERNPLKEWMEYVMEWTLVHRTDEEMRDLIPKSSSELKSSVELDSTEVNVFLEIEKQTE